MRLRYALRFEHKDEGYTYYCYYASGNPKYLFIYMRFCVSCFLCFAQEISFFLIVFSFHTFYDFMELSKSAFNCLSGSLLTCRVNFSLNRSLYKTSSEVLRLMLKIC